MAESASLSSERLSGPLLEPLQGSIRRVSDATELPAARLLSSDAVGEIGDDTKLPPARLPSSDAIDTPSSRRGDDDLAPGTWHPSTGVSFEVPQADDAAGLADDPDANTWWHRLHTNARDVKDILYRRPNINGVSYREFEVELLEGETIYREPIRVRLKKTETFGRKCCLAVFTLGLSLVWRACCATGSLLFDEDARIAITSKGRLLLWTHSAKGGSAPVLKHVVESLTDPVGLLVIGCIVGTIVFGPAMGWLS